LARAWRREDVMKKSLIAVTALYFVVSSVAWAQNISTRFGALTLDEDHLLRFRGRPVQPKVQGNNSLTFVKTFLMGSKDVVLVQDNGGTGCPAQFHFVTVSSSGAKATAAFGSCSDLIKVARVGDSIKVDMPGFAGPVQSEAQWQRESRKRYVYFFKNGRVNETIVQPKANSKVNSQAFNPYTIYFPMATPPKGFKHFQGFVLNREPGARSKVSGAVLTNLSNSDSMALQKVSVQPKRLTFTTVSRVGERFDFRGRFLQGGNIARFSTAPDAPHKVAVAAGTVRRTVNGKAAGVTQMRFFCESGAG
jgi:hypothetical protein